MNYIVNWYNASKYNRLGDYNNTGFMLLACNSSNSKVMKALHTKKLLINHKNWSGETALMLACKTSRITVELLQAFLEYPEIDLSVVNHAGLGALSILSSNTHYLKDITEMLRMLMSCSDQNIVDSTGKRFYNYLFLNYRITADIIINIIPYLQVENTELFLNSCIESGKYNDSMLSMLTIDECPLELLLKPFDNKNIKIVNELFSRIPTNTDTELVRYASTAVDDMRAIKTEVLPSTDMIIDRFECIVDSFVLGGADTIISHLNSSINNLTIDSSYRKIKENTTNIHVIPAPTTEPKGIPAPDAVHTTSDVVLEGETLGFAYTPTTPLPKLSSLHVEYACRNPTLTLNVFKCIEVHADTYNTIKCFELVCQYCTCPRLIHYLFEKIEGDYSKEQITDIIKSILFYLEDRINSKSYNLYKLFVPYIEKELLIKNIQSDLYKCIHMHIDTWYSTNYI